jgi:hypothetical protein
VLVVAVVAVVDATVVVDAVVVVEPAVVAEVDEVVVYGWLRHAPAFWLCDQHGGCVRATPAPTANPVAKNVPTAATTANPRTAVILMPDEIRGRPHFLRVNLGETARIPRLREPAGQRSLRRDGPTRGCVKKKPAR